MQIDDKLLEILESMGESYYPLHEYPPSYEPQNVEARKNALAEIKAALQEAGYVQIPQAELVESWKRGEKPKYTINGQEVMSGREWYNKFELELLDKPAEFDRQMNAMVEVKEVREAARKASGVE